MLIRTIDYLLQKYIMYTAIHIYEQNGRYTCNMIGVTIPALLINSLVAPALALELS